MRYSISDTAEYGDLTRGPVVIDEHVRETMRGLLRDIQEGRFARDIIAEEAAGRPQFQALRRRAAEHQIEQVGAELRAMMPWIGQCGEQDEGRYLTAGAARALLLRRLRRRQGGDPAGRRAARRP